MSVASMEVEQSLLRFARRRRLYAILNWLMIGAAAAGFWLLAAAIVDRWIGVGTSAREAMLLAALLLILLCVVRALLSGPISGERAIVQAAQSVESRLPACRERLMTVITQRQMPEAWKGSAALCESLAEDVAQVLRQRPPWRMIGITAVRNGASALSAMLLAGLVTAVIVGPRFPALLARQVVPWASIGKVSGTRIEISNPVTELRAGQALSVVADVSPDLGEATLWIGRSAVEAQAVPMTRVFGGRYAITLPRIEHATVYRVQAGDAESRQFSLAISPPTMIDRIDLQLHSRDGATSTITKSDGHFVAPLGTRVFLTLTANEPLDDAILNVAGVTIPTQPTEQPNVRTAEFRPMESGRWSISLTPATGSEVEVLSDLRITTVPPASGVNLPADVRVPGGYESAVSAYLRAISTTQP